MRGPNRCRDDIDPEGVFTAQTLTRRAAMRLVIGALLPSRQVTERQALSWQRVGDLWALNGAGGPGSTFRPDRRSAGSRPPSSYRTSPASRCIGAHTDRVRPLPEEATVIDDPDRHRLEPPRHMLGELLAQRRPFPGTLPDELL